MLRSLFCAIYLLATALSSCTGSSDNDDNEKPGGSYVYTDTRPSQQGHKPVWDPQGYVFFCLCMGRIGNQVEHFLGSMAFANKLNRTLVLPPFRTYRNIRFTEWFRFEPIAFHQKVVLAEDFMEFLAPTHWPPGKRLGFCWLPQGSTEKDCRMKEGNPFGPFWDGLKVDFDGSVVHGLSYSWAIAEWKTQFPPEKFPVLAFRGAPASYPVDRTHRDLQRHLKFSSRVEDEAYKYIENHFGGEKFVGLHLRNGADWNNSCKYAIGQRSYMASPQCLEDSGGAVVTQNMCFPTTEEVLRMTEYVTRTANIKIVFVATDKNPMISEIEEHLKDAKVKVYHADPWLPVIDWAILVKADYFIGNCVSSFTSFVKRARDIETRPTYFWGVN